MNHIPVNIYRLQLHKNFTFYDAIAVLPYLRDLGIETLCCSPFFQAVKGSQHGYDIVNPLKFNGELGGEKGFQVFQSEAHSLGFGIIMDLVANHMAASVENPWWYDVLEKGPYSPYALYFNIDWEPPLKRLFHKVLVPILDKPFKEALLVGDIQLVEKDSSFFIAAMGQFFPLNPASYPKSPHEVQAINKDKGLLEVLLEKQYFLLEFWQSASQNINYRRFFDINGLVALNVHHKNVFDHFHKKALELLKSGAVQGVRIDHPDGLYEPYQYFKRLREPLATRSLYMVIEKILEKDEVIPQKWPVEGSVGYEYLNLLNQLFVDKRQERHFSELYERFLGERVDQERLLQEEKRQFALLYMTSEIHAMSLRLFKAHKELECNQEELEEAIVELYVFFPVYRSYLEKESTLMTSEEKEVFFEAFDRASVNKPHLEKSFYFLKTLFFHERELQEADKEFIMKFQQLSPSIMAKGFEDTHLYNYNRFIALNEVGSMPHDFGGSIEDFHEKILLKQKTFPYGWVTLSTHDTKRSYEVRMRLHVLCEIFEEWQEMVMSWKKENERYKQGGFPDNNREFFLYQTLVGLWPVAIQSEEKKNNVTERLKAYLIKAARESKAYTNWVHHHIGYERALLAFIDKILTEDSAFYVSLCQFVKKIERASQLSALSCLNLFLGLPSPIDIYQGTELWDFSLVDPDNRREVDYDKRKKVIEEINAVILSGSEKKWMLNVLKKENIEILKPYLLKVFFSLRKEHKEGFLQGEYIPLVCKGKRENHVVAYIRKWKDFCCIVLSTRFLLHYGKKDFWEDTQVELPQCCEERLFLNVYTKQVFKCTKVLLLQEVLQEIPFSLFCSIKRS